MNYEKKKDLAKDMAEIAIGANQLRQLICGADLYRIEVPNTAGEKELATNIIMDALYEMHKETPAKGYDKLVEETLVTAFKTVKGSKYMDILLRTIEYQLSAERNGFATFKMDFEKCYESFRSNLQVNQQFYADPSRKDEWYGMVEHHEQILGGTFGQKLR